MLKSTDSPIVAVNGSVSEHPFWGMLTPEQVWNIAGAINTQTLNKDESVRVSEVGGRERRGEREREGRRERIFDHNNTTTLGTLIYRVLLSRILVVA